jgi:hypothetical protein
MCLTTAAFRDTFLMCSPPPPPPLPPSPLCLSPPQRQHRTQSCRCLRPLVFANVSALAELRELQVAVFNGHARGPEENQSPAAVDEGTESAAADALAPADTEQSSDSARRLDWMHRLRPGDIVLVSALVCVEIKPDTGPVTLYENVPLILSNPSFSCSKVLQSRVLFRT